MICTQSRLGALTTFGHSCHWFNAEEKMQGSKKMTPRTRTAAMGSQQTCLLDVWWPWRNQFEHDQSTKATPLTAREHEPCRKGHSPESCIRASCHVHADMFLVHGFGAPGALLQALEIILRSLCCRHTKAKTTLVRCPIYIFFFGPQRSVGQRGHNTSMHTKRSNSSTLNRLHHFRNLYTGSQGFTLLVGPQ